MTETKHDTARRLNDRLAQVADRLRRAKIVTNERPATELEQVLAQRIWLSLGGRRDRVERFITELRRIASARP